MKRFVALAAAFAVSFTQAQETSVDALIQSLREAITQKDWPRYESLIYTAGMSESDLVLARRATASLTAGNSEIDTISAAPLPENFQSILVARGKKYEPTASPIGLIRIAFRPSKGSSLSTSFPYAEKDGRFFLVGTKSSELPWSGPPDHQIGFSLSGRGQDKAKIQVKWNASGVNLEENFSSPSAVLIGQYIDAIKVTSDQADAELSLTVRNEGKPIYTSETLKGPGAIDYQRPSP